jgi:hypothetical protein
MKVCTKCHIKKPLEDFYKKETPDGKTSYCKMCMNEKSKLYNDVHREQVLANKKAYSLAHKEERAAQWPEKYLKTKPQVMARYEKNRKHINEVKKVYRESNKERLSLDFKRWAAENREEYLARRRVKKAIRMETNPKDRLNASIAERVRASLVSGKGGRTWESLVGYSLEKLKKHIEKQFSPGMTWDNYGKWHVDHRIPIKAFNFTSSDDLDFKRCWDLKNLQPLWSYDNISKGARLERPFQPSLAIGCA